VVAAYQLQPYLAHTWDAPLWKEGTPLVVGAVSATAGASSTMAARGAAAAVAAAVASDPGASPAPSAAVGTAAAVTAGTGPAAAAALLPSWVAAGTASCPCRAASGAV
jgi:hypothetical protein